MPKNTSHSQVGCKCFLLNFLHYVSFKTLVNDEIFPDLSTYADINAVILPVISESSYNKCNELNKNVNFQLNNLMQILKNILF